MPSLPVAVYLILGLALFGGIFYALSQVAGRQRRLHAELTRLEQLTAEVAMTAEAMLDKIDERIERMNRIAIRAEARVKAAALPAAPAETVSPDVTTAPPVAPVPAGTAAVPGAAPVPSAGTYAVRRKRGRPRKYPLPEQMAAMVAGSAPATAAAQAPVPAPAPTPTAAADPLPAATAVFSQPAPTTADMSQRSAKVQAVFKMAAEGKSVPDIAAELAIPRGEVQLILNLRKVTA